MKSKTFGAFLLLFQDILAKIQDLSPRAVIIDSIQTVYLNNVAGSAGGITQVGIFLLDLLIMFSCD